MPQIPYHLKLPDDFSCGVVFASPHSGRHYTDSFLTQAVLNAQILRSSEDAFVDQLFACAPDYGCPLLHANMPRAYVDLNRKLTDLDAEVIEDIAQSAFNPRVLSGLGVIPRVVANSREIYRGKLTMAEAVRRLDAYWWPYHTRLHSLLSDAQAKFGQALLIDCHSMPREALDSIFSPGNKRPEIVLGDRFGASASPPVIERIQRILTGVGFAVSRNMPFAGAHIVQHYGRPAENQHAVQLEIDRSLYMNEATLVPHDGFAELSERLQLVVAQIADFGREVTRLAAE